MRESWLLLAVGWQFGSNFNTTKQTSLCSEVIGGFMCRFVCSGIAGDYVYQKQSDQATIINVFISIYPRHW